MVDVSTIRDTVVAVSVSLGIVFAIVQIRGLARDRRTRLVLEIFSHVGTEEFSEHFARIWNAEFKDAKQAEEKCTFLTLSMVARYYEGVGLLIRRGLVDADLIFESMPFSTMWAKMSPWCLDMRARSNIPDLHTHFENGARMDAEYAAEKVRARAESAQR